MLGLPPQCTPRVGYRRGSDACPRIRDRASWCAKRSHIPWVDNREAIPCAGFRWTPSRPGPFALPTRASCHATNLGTGLMPRPLRCVHGRSSSTPVVQPLPLVATSATGYCHSGLRSYTNPRRPTFAEPTCVGARPIRLLLLFAWSNNRRLFPRCLSPSTASFLLAIPALWARTTGPPRPPRWRCWTALAALTLPAGRLRRTLHSLATP